MNTTKKSGSADNPAETTKASSTNGYANCFEVEYYSMSGGGIAGSTGCTRLVGRVLRGEFQPFQSAVLASENRGFNTLIASVWAHGTRTGNVVTSVGGRFTVIIDGVFSSLPTDCREATLAVLPGKSPWGDDAVRTWHLSRSTSVANHDPHQGLELRAPEPIISESGSFEWPYFLTENRLLHFRLRPPQGDVHGAGVPWTMGQDIRKMEHAYVPLLERARNLVEKGLWQDFYRQFPAQDVAGRGVPTAITRISGGSFDLSIPGYGTIIGGGGLHDLHDKPFCPALAERQPHWTGMRMEYHKGKWWESGEKTGWFVKPGEKPPVVPSDGVGFSTPRMFLVSNMKRGQILPGREWQEWRGVS